MFSRIVIGVDGSTASMKALKQALNLGKKLGSSIDVLYVIPSRVYAELSERMMTVHDHGETQRISILQKEENELSDRIVKIASEEDMQVEIHTRVGDPVEGLIEFASSNGGDLIVVGSSGKGMADRLILGSVSDGVVHKSPVPVLILKPETR